MDTQLPHGVWKQADFKDIFKWIANEMSEKIT